MRTAIHEAGHLFLDLAIGVPVAIATIDPDLATATLGRVTSDVAAAHALVPHDATPADPVAVNVAVVAILFAGEAAERICFGQADGGCEDDRLRSNAAAVRINDALGLDSRTWRPEVERVVEAFLREHWPHIERLAAALIEARSITGAHALEIVPVPPKIRWASVDGAMRFWSQRMAARSRSPEATP